MARISQLEIRQIRTELLDFIEGYIAKHGYAPTPKEMQKGIARTAPTTRSHLRALEQEGRIKLGEGSRAITVIKSNKELHASQA